MSGATSGDFACLFLQRLVIKATTISLARRPVLVIEEKKKNIPTLYTSFRKYIA